MTKPPIIKIWERQDAKSLGFPGKWHGIRPTQFWLDAYLMALNECDELLSPSEVRSYFGISTSVVRKYAKDGKVKLLQEYRSGGIRFSKLNIMECLERGTIKATNPV
jgi:hypothetical protein